MADWESTYLRTAGFPDTPANRRLLSTWQRYEGGHTKNNARFNYLNTTQNMSGARSINSVGVKAYRTLQQGALAWAKTLKNGRYSDLYQGFKTGDPYKTNVVRGLSTWLSGSPDSAHGHEYASRVLGEPGGAAMPPDSSPGGSVPAPVSLDIPRLGRQSLMRIARGEKPTESFARLSQVLARQRQNIGLPGDPQTPTGAPLTPSGVEGKVILLRGADRAGARTQQDILNFAAQVAGVYGRPLKVGTGTNHSQMTVNGNQSQHWTGEAVDIPASGVALLRMGRAALIAAGMPRAQAMKQKGGLYNVGGHQIIFRTTEGGNHWNHLHLGF